MSINNSTSKQAIRERAQKRRQRQKLIPTILITSLGVILIGFAVYFIVDFGPANDSSNYDEDDTVYDQPLFVIHEMDGSTIDQISFLPKDDPQPKIVVSEDFYNFGSIGPSDVVKRDFVITNQGDAPLTISRAYTTCGCTTAEFTGTVIPPGKVVIVTMVLDAGYHDVRGQTVRRGIIIENNDPKNPQVELWAQASVLNSP